MPNKHFAMRILSVAAFSTIILLNFTACASKPAANKDKQAPATQQDMTRPPVTIGAEREVVVETNPNETISFEQWKELQDTGADSSETEKATQQEDSVTQ